MQNTTTEPTPNFLKEHATAYGDDPRAACLSWFRSARFGLFMHYGLYSLLEGEWDIDLSTLSPQKQAKVNGEWIQITRNIPLKEYAKLKDRFTADQFDADAICKLAKAAGMRYLNLTTQHHDGFCLWDTDTTDFSSVHAPAKRDLVAEFVDACDRHGLGCFLYYSHGRDWWHPDSPDYGGWSCRPEIAEDREHFNWGDDIVLDRYLDLVSAQVKELCQYKNVAGIWLDGIGGFRSMENGARISRAQELYDLIHQQSPHILVSYKQGLTFTEDFYAPERNIKEGTVPSDGRPYEICTTLQPFSWGYRREDDGQHFNADWVMEQLQIADSIPANLLLNTGPLGNGRIPQEDEQTLKEVGERLSMIAS